MVRSQAMVACQPSKRAAMPSGITTIFLACSTSRPAAAPPVQRDDPSGTHDERFGQEAALPRPPHPRHQAQPRRACRRLPDAHAGPSTLDSSIAPGQSVKERIAADGKPQGHVPAARLPADPGGPVARRGPAPAKGGAGATPAWCATSSRTPYSGRSHGFCHTTGRLADENVSTLSGMTWETRQERGP